MNTRLLICATLIFFAALDGISQRQPRGATWKAPRTPDGQPDLQGIWTNANLTPLQRPAELGDKQFFTEHRKQPHMRINAFSKPMSIESMLSAVRPILPGVPITISGLTAERT